MRKLNKLYAIISLASLLTANTVLATQTFPEFTQAPMSELVSDLFKPGGLYNIYEDVLFSKDGKLPKIYYKNAIESFHNILSSIDQSKCVDEIGETYIELMTELKNINQLRLTESEYKDKPYIERKIKKLFETLKTAVIEDDSHLHIREYQPMKKYEKPKQVGYEYVTLNHGNKNVQLSQHNTGEYGSTNCVPTSIAMVYNWLGVQYDSVQDIRFDIIPPSDRGGITQAETESYLKNISSLKYTTNIVNTREELINLSKSQILLISVDSNRLYESDTYGVASENGKNGHAFLISGYYNGPEGEYFELLDPSYMTVAYKTVDEIFNAYINWTIPKIFGFDYYSAYDENNTYETTVKDLLVTSDVYDEIH